MNEVLYINTKSARLGQHRSSLEELPPPEARGGGWEEQPNLQGAVAAWVQEGLQELFHIQGGGAVFSVRRYPSSKVRSTGCILL